MPSSTSNSNDRCPSVAYTRLWFWIVMLLGLFLLTSELYWRNQGFLPNIVDNKLYWSEQRHQVYTHEGKRRLVIVGSSRAQLGIDPSVINEHFPEFEVIHLAIDGALAFEVLKDLCNDSKFDGIILADATVPFLCATDPAATQKEREYITYYHTQFKTAAELEKRFNAYLGASLQSSFVIFSPALSFKTLLYTRLKPKWLYVHMQKNRFRPAYYYDRLTEEERSKHRRKRITSITKNPTVQISNDLFEQVAKRHLKAPYTNLQSRGGKMVLVRLPTTGQHWQIDQNKAPKEKFWDRLEMLSGVPTVHFKDHNTLSDFDCPDTSHLDATDVPEFTQELGKIVRETLNLRNTNPERNL